MIFKQNVKAVGKLWTKVLLKYFLMRKRQNLTPLIISD